MNRKQYFDILEKNLKSLDKEETDDILQDFTEYFEIGIERGRTEQELMASLGSPKTLARQIMFESYVKQAEKSASAAHIGKAVFTSIGLSFFNLIFILPLFLIIFSILSALFIVAVAISAAGVTGAIGSLFLPVISQYVTFNTFIHPAVMVFAFLGIGAFGVIFFIGDIFFSRFLFRLTARYLRFNLEIIRERRQQNEG
jgi:uncharacterized membrane protein